MLGAVAWFLLVGFVLFLAGVAVCDVAGVGEGFVRNLICFFILFLNGAGAAELELALEHRVASVVIQFRNISVAPMTFAVGGRTGLGAFYNLEFTGVRSDGKTCKVIDTTVGFVAGSLEPIVLRIAAGSNESVSIERKHLICLPSGAWSKLRATFTATAANNSWAKVSTGWTGTATSH